MNLFLESGYADMHAIMSLPYPFIFVIGGRGTGKSYGAFKEILELPQGDKFLLLRRTGEEADAISFTELSPFQPVINDDPELYPPVVCGPLPHVKALAGVWHGEPNDKGELKPAGDPIGYISALVRIYKIRGFYMEDVKMLLFDEFQPEKHVKRIRSEGESFLNSVETISRNRELRGEKPLKSVCLSNSESLACPIFQALGIISDLDKAFTKGKHEYINQEKGIAVFKLPPSPISERKADTALYRAARDSDDFITMSLKNDFDKSTYLYVEPAPIAEYKIVADIGQEIYIYRHKSAPLYYVTRHQSGPAKYKYNTDVMSIKRLKREQKRFFEAWLRGNIKFADYYSKYYLTSLL